MKSPVAAIVLLLVSSARADEWPPVSAAEMAMKTPQVEPQADAEALVWDVRISHELSGGSGRTEQWQYLRVKIFSEAGRDRLGTVDIPYGPNHSVSDIEGRTIRPDGSIAELSKNSVYDRTVVKAGGTKVNVKSFALPGLEVGSIIEYRWKEGIEFVGTDLRLQFQRDIPVHLVRYHLRPIKDSSFPYGMSSLPLHVDATPFASEKDGYFVTSASRIPAFKEEIDMPPEAVVRPWMLVYYTVDRPETPERYWQSYGKLQYGAYRLSIKVSQEIRAAALAAVKDVTGDEARLRKLSDYLASEVVNTSYGLDERPAESRPRPKENNNTADTWKQRSGTSYDITLLYLAFAEALGYEARLARVSRRDFGGFVPSLKHSYFLRDFVAAVKVGGAWKFCDPGYPFLSFGLLYDSEQGQAALITDPDRPELVAVPIAPPDASQTRREGTLTLAADGSLEGDVRFSYSGYAASGRKSRYRRKAESEREEAVRDAVKSALGASEVTSISLAGLTGSEPLTIACHVKISGYAEQAGQRLLVPTSLFSRRGGARYSASERRYPVEFDSAWVEHDTVTYHLPHGFAVEGAEQPGSIIIRGVGEYATSLAASGDGRTLQYERRFDFGRDGHLSFPPTAYPQLKQVFDKVRELDGQTLSLKQVAR